MTTVDAIQPTPDVQAEFEQHLAAVESYRAEQAREYQPPVDDEVNEDDRFADQPGVADLNRERERRRGPWVKMDRLETELMIGSDVEIARHTAAWLQERNGTVVFAEGHFWRFASTHWIKIASEHMRVGIHKFDGVKIGPAVDENGEPRRQPANKLNKSRVDSILSEVSAILARPDFFASPALGINCASGFIRFDDDGRPELEPHNPHHRSRHLISATWPLSEEPAAGQSLLDTLLTGCFGGDVDAVDKRGLIAEIAGCAALGYATKLIKPKAVVLFGQTAENGKSQILDMLRGLLPGDAVSSVTLGKLGDDKYAVHLVGKLLNASDELTSAAAISSDAFKTAITGEPISCRDVYQSAITFRPAAQHVYATNDLPAFRAGMDRGVIRRLLVVTFNRSIPEDERIEHIGSRIAQDEADLLLDFAVAGASRLIARRAFPEIESSKRALRDWVEGVDPVAALLASDAVEVTGELNDMVTPSELHRRFKLWATGEGYAEATLPAINQFSMRVMAGSPKIGQKRRAKGRFFTGIKLAR